MPEKGSWLLSLFIILLFTLFLQGCNGGPSYVPAVSTCVDSDGGLNYNISGIVTVTSNGINTTYTDTCSSSSILGEYSCTGNNSQYSTYNCPSGCLNGACVTPPPTPQPAPPSSNTTNSTNATTPSASCTDTDGGSNIYTKGSVTTSAGTVTDTCTSNTYLNEYSCGSSGVVSSSMLCANGCVNGACLQNLNDLPNVCTDSDNGINYYVGGILTVNNGVISHDFLDACSGSTLIERYCAANGSAASLSFSCPNGCENNGDYISKGQCRSSPYAAVKCTDSDGNVSWGGGTIDIFKKGTASSTSGNSGTDYCINPSFISEYACATDYATNPTAITYFCPNNYKCSDGACVPSPGQVNPETYCNETDGGQNYYSKGSLTFINSLGLQVYNDTCATPSSSNTLIEYYCSGIKMSSINYNCPSGYICSNGACVVNQTIISPPPTIYDSDADGFSDTVENYIGTNPNQKCQAAPNSAGVTTPNTAWPPDLNGDGTVTNADSLLFNPHFGSNTGQPNYDKRFDLNTDGKISLADVLVLSPYYNITTCQNGISLPTTASCTDSDGGANYGVKGTTSNSSGFLRTDYCVTYSSNSLVEYSCAPFGITSTSTACTYGCFDGRCTNQGETCPAGWYCYNNYSTAYVSSSCLWSNFKSCLSGQVCSNGACVQSPNTTVTPPAPTCTDSDGSLLGDNQFRNKGSVTVTNLSGTYNLDDYCQSSGILKEQICSNNKPVDFTYPCPSQTTCQNGACIANNQTSLTCVDSDGGIVQSIKGRITLSSGEVYDDVCSDGNPYKILEYYCSGGYAAASYGTCPAGQYCKNGACVQGNPLPSSASSTNCSENDGGNNIFTTGITNFFYAGYPGTFDDFCQTPNVLIESSCNGSLMQISSITCPSGYFCKGDYWSGACVPGTAPPPVTSSSWCTDSDGLNIFNKGTVNFFQNGLTPVPYSESDSCQNGVLLEGFCQGDTHLTRSITCPNGYFCQSGACIPGSATIPPPAPNSCTDSDGGNNTFIAGTTNFVYYGTNWFNTDVCVTSAILQENYCQDSISKFSVVTCPNGCNNGACLPTATNQTKITSLSLFPISTLPAFRSILTTNPPFDFNNNGKKEFITTTYATFDPKTTFNFWEASSDNSFLNVYSLVTEIGASVSYFPDDVGDSDGDGLKELLVHGRTDTPGLVVNSSFYVRLYEQTNSKSYPDHISWQVPTTWWTVGAKIVDLDNDGKKEIIFAGQDDGYSQKLQDYESTGNNAYSKIYSYNFSDITTIQCFNVLNDVDGNGKKEAAVGGLTKGSSRLYLFESRGDNSLSPIWNTSLDYSVGSPVNCHNVFSLDDADGDGKKEFVVGGFKKTPVLGSEPFSSVYYVFEANGINNFQKTATIRNYNLSFFGDTAATAGDLDADGKNEIVIANEADSYGDRVMVYRAVGDNTYNMTWSKTWTKPATVAEWLDTIGIGDHDGDGKPELIFNEYNSAVATKVYEKI